MPKRRGRSRSRGSQKSTSTKRPTRARSTSTNAASAKAKAAATESRRRARRAAAKATQRETKALSPAYAKRLARAQAKGLSRQAARGHKKAEHVERAAHEREKYGATKRELETVRRWYESSYNPAARYDKDRPTIDRMIEWVTGHGYEKFKAFRAEWEGQRSQYVRDSKRGRYPQGGYGITAVDTYDDDYYDFGDDGDSWWHYH